MNVPLKIFLAEDDADDRELFQIFLKDRRDISELVAVENGIDLLDTLKKLQPEKLPDLIILDQNMPKLNGLDTLENIKTNKSLKHIPVMVYSTYASEILTEDGLQKGAVYICPKPDCREGYINMIDRFLTLAQKTGIGN